MNSLISFLKLAKTDSEIIFIANNEIATLKAMGNQWKVIWPGALVVLSIFAVVIGIISGVIDPKNLMI